MGTLKQAVDRVAAAKTAIGNAITAKGGTVAAGDGLEEFAAEIMGIPAPTFEACELIKSSGLGGEVYGFNTEDRTIVAGLLYKAGSYSSIVLTFPQGFTPRYTKFPYGTMSVYYDYGYGNPRTFDVVNITDSNITLTTSTLRGFNNSSQTKQIPICMQFTTN